MTRRFISNIERIMPPKPGRICHVMSYSLAYRSRPSIPEGGFYVAVRRDVLRRGVGLALCAAQVHLDQTMIFDGALSTLL